jgi:hypothetical protein
MNGHFDRDQRVKLRGVTIQARSGDVYGVVVKVDDRGFVHVRMDRTGRLFKFASEDLIAVEV